MLKLGRLFCLVGGIVGAWTASAAGQRPAFTMRVAAINDVRIPGGPARQITAAPGDEIVAEVYARDWSPNEETLNAYQAQIDPMSYSTGPVGFIEPVDYQKERGDNDDNRANCFVDKSHPLYVHRGMDSLALTDSRSAGYRWLSVLLNHPGPVSKQDGVEYYCGTVRLRVSDNAKGKFVIGFIEDDQATGLRNYPGQAILPVDFESLEIMVDSAVEATRPPAGAANVIRLVDALNGVTEMPLRLGDLDGDGKLGGADLLRAVDVLNQEK